MEDLQKKIQELLKNFSREEFIFDFLSIYIDSKATLKRLHDGDKNKLEEKGELELRSKLFFKEAEENLYATIDEIKNKLKGKRTDPRFIIVTNYDDFLAYDIKTKDTLDIKISELDTKYSFFLPWSGTEKYKIEGEIVADVKAAQNLAKLYDEITKTNPHKTEEEIHNLNIFLSRLLFCYFAEDTNIFKKNQFTNTIGSNTEIDGENTKDLLEKVFKTFNVKEENREKDLPDYLSEFPYVNGKLFAEQYPIPTFTTKSRKVLLDMGSLDWSEINPDIFGSMMQAVVDSENRSSLGMHYTSVPNIMKLIKPLFLDDLQEEFENNIGNSKKLELLRIRLSKIKFFDPACGSGNFLIITYKEIRRLEIDILKSEKGESVQALPGVISSNIKLSQFYGIEIDNFAHETAKLSMYLAEHQMNVEFEKETGFNTKPLPLKDGGNIVQGNAARVDWEEVCPKEENDEIYILGNPPYLGSKMQDRYQKEDMAIVLYKFKKFKNLDYIAIWFYKGVKYIGNNKMIKLAFVSTNSISQGTQVNDFWPNIIEFNIEIFFAVTTFKWINNAKGNAGVSVVIIGLRSESKDNRHIYTNRIKRAAKNINAYLLATSDIFIEKRTSPISVLPKMTQGNIPLENGYLRLSDLEKKEIINEFPESKVLFKKATGSREALNDELRWCLWINNSQLDLALSIKPIKERIEKVKEFRLSGATNAQATANRPHTFVMTNTAIDQQLVIPIVSSERREFIPVSIFDNNYIVMNSALVIYDPEVYIMGILSSTMHRIWMSTFSGKLRSDYRYSVGLCWYSFPFPKITEKQKEKITELVYEILDERAKHSEQTLAQMYDPEKMPEGLRYAHHQLDLAIEKIYRPKPFESDEERLEYLFKLYEKMIIKEKEDKNK